MKILDTMRIVSGTSGYQSIDQEFPSIPQSAIEETFEVEPVRFIPLETPCSWSGWTFAWFQPVITLGRRKVIKKDDMLRLPPCLTSKEVLASFMRCWAFESLRTTMIASEHSFTIATSKKPKLWRVLHTMIQKEFWFAGICRFANDALLVLGTLLIKEIISAAQRQDTRSAVILAVLITLSSVGQALLLQQFIHGCFMSASRVVSATTSAVFYSTIALRVHKMDPPKSIAQINNVQSKDTSALRDFVVFFHNLWACPVTIVACVGLLFYMLGIAGLVSFFLLVALIPLQSYIAKLAKSARKSVLKHSDARMEVINGLVDGIYTVKLTELVPLIYQTVSALREKELSVAWYGMLIEIGNTVLTRSGSLLIILLTFVVYAYVPSNGPLTADRAFAALAVINILGRPLQVIPKSITIFTDALVSLDRIQAIICEAEKYDKDLFAPNKNNEKSCYQNDENNENSDIDDFKEILQPTSITVKSVTAVRGKNTVILKDISFSLASTGLTVIVGGNASGKTSLLLSILNELILVQGKSSIRPSQTCVAYSAHDPWIVNATAKENIVMAAPHTHDDDRYRRAVSECSLTQDISSWIDGDDTLIGERGINISGGQRQRISLARAIYSHAKIFLLDTPLSGLDVIVAQNVFNEAILKAAESRMVVMTDCTYKPSILSKAIRILALEEGRLVFDGSYSAFLQSNHSVTFARSDTTDQNNSLGTIERIATKKVPENILPSSNSSSLAKGKSSRGVRTDDIVTSVQPWKVYLDYIDTCGYHNIVAALVFSVGAYVCGVLGDYQLSYWTDGTYTPVQYFFFYSCISLVVILLNFLRYYSYSLAGIRTSKILHDRLLKAILGAPFSFFSSTPSGRISSRFSVDFDTIDFNIPGSMSSLLDAVFGIVTGVGVIIVSSPIYTLVIGPLAYKYLQVQDLYRNVSKELKKIDSAEKSPLFSHFKESLGGLEVIRSYRIENQILEEHHRLLDRSVSARLNWDFANRWMGIRLDLIGAVIISSAAFSVVFTSLYSASGGQAGMILSYALKATQSLTFAIRASAALESMFTSPDRVGEYIMLEQEVPIHEQNDFPLHIENKSVFPKPSNVEIGKVVLKADNIVARYAADLPPALNNISFTLKSGCLVGVCGRTGCGKSTLTLFLARALQNFQGNLSVHGVPISSIPLSSYRSILQVYPQGSYIFGGRLRSFLDPKGIFEDRKLHQILKDLTDALEHTTSRVPPSTSFSFLPSAVSAIFEETKANENEKVEEKGETNKLQLLNLEFVCAAGGSNMSSGQLQVLTLARAALCDADIVLLDEITSNMDGHAAVRAIEIVKRELTGRGASVILVAHSLSDVAMCDEVWVMSAGTIIEKGTPEDLMARSDGIFAFMNSKNN